MNKVGIFNTLSKEDQREEIEKCSSFEYFYNNFCKRESMPDFSQKAWEEYVESNTKLRFSRRRTIGDTFYPLPPEGCFKK